MTYEMALTALADPSRRNIFEALRTCPRTVTDIAGEQPISRPAVSQHLKVLQTAGLVEVYPKGTARYYGIRHAGLAELRSYLDGFWDDVLEAYAAEVDRQTGEQNG
ncbi:ArsR/SmtB family transcription factor [Hoeflea prorocentri]|uniref:Metalloregulator ArsR/SmtB family transcription factor n=1 Tax=Hoeflea prorocentri TaxID=1922333 RepID=A0A9X3UJP3_9HYPH|nr:metalloregulator ArsR/SmtB family transcription factor [Hoeflea prorocentri]MCY6380016.1 metalloregulator ArsR/SmtB family transcription factor [Hoeflea prorocentri]MDA5397816.1 metalloregulator ArsR/SmtB family transcription factor [Hoeflea prorocentri]